MPHLDAVTIEGNPNLGLFASCNDSICVAGYSSLSRNANEVLGVNLLETTISFSRATGIFLAMNSNGIAIPHIAEDSELSKLKKLGLNVCIIKTTETALGNLILVNDKGCVMSATLSKFKKELEDCFGCEVLTGTLAGLDLVGSCAVATNKGLLAHRDCTEQELNHMESVLKVKGDIGTANFGSPFVGAFILANSKGFLVSDLTTGPEIARIDEALGFI